jgi:anti-anti-sigma factor
MLDAYRPCLVLDCSNLRQMDRKAMQLLLFSLEQALKRNGDVRLAGVAPEAMAMLEPTGMDRLFRFFASSNEAVRSFDRHLNDYLAERPQSAEADAA